MSQEIIALLGMLRDETQSRDVHARCQAAIAELKWTEASPNAKAWNTTVAGRHYLWIDGSEEVRIK